VFCATPFAFGVPGLQLVYLIPIALAYWVLRVRTTADSRGVIVRTALGTHAIEWERVSSIRVPDRGWVRALVSGKEIPLAGVRARHLPLLAAASGGRIADPSETPPTADAHTDTAGDADGQEPPENPDSENTTAAAGPEKAPAAAD
jgi:hypothetical protein